MASCEEEVIYAFQEVERGSEDEGGTINEVLFSGEEKLRVTCIPNQRGPLRLLGHAIIEDRVELVIRCFVSCFFPGIYIPRYTAISSKSLVPSFDYLSPGTGMRPRRPWRGKR